MESVGLYLAASFKVEGLIKWDKPSTLRSFIRALIQELDTELRQFTQEKFEPQGTTVIAIIAESHISVHTFPENDILTLDIFCCNKNKDLLKAIKTTENFFEVREKSFNIYTR